MIKFLKTHPDAVLPKKAHDTDTGYDLTAVEDMLIPSNGFNVVPVGITVAFISPGIWFRIEARSGLGFKHSIFPHFGVIDNSYRGDLGVKLYNFGGHDYWVKKGDRIAQIVIYPLLDHPVTWTTKIRETDRGENGFGSTDKSIIPPIQGTKRAGIETYRKR